jgi:hypothetical protein
LTLLNFQNNLYRDNRTLTEQLAGLRERLTIMEAKPPGNINVKDAPVPAKQPGAPTTSAKGRKDAAK